MYETFGFQDLGHGQQSITLFVPDNEVDPTQYTRGGPSRITSISIIGDFQQALDPNAQNWDTASGLAMSKDPHENGFVWRYTFPRPLAEGFYQYLYFVQFEDGSSRSIGDPCTKYGGTSNDRSAFVVGGRPIVVEPIANRLPTPELRIYEIEIDDFTAGFRGKRAPVDAIVDKLDGLVELGINALEFMPWTADPDDAGFSWGYNPAFFFSVESDYVSDGKNAIQRLCRLADLVTECHRRGVHVFQDIVLQHASGGSQTNGFPYYWLWLNASECPFVGEFVDVDSFGSLPLDYNNACTEQLAVDVCTYWLKTFRLDGLRFDQVTGFAILSEPSKGAPGVIAKLREWLSAAKLQNVALILEDSWGYQAVNDANQMNASGTWFDMFRSLPFTPFTGYISTGQLSTDYMRALNASYQFKYPISPVNYLENHDHSTIAYSVGGREQWPTLQPYMIALATCPGAVMLHNGQEWGQVEVLWEDDSHAPPQFKRVQPRPLDWSQATDEIGKAITARYSQLLGLRAAHPGLRSPNFYPDTYDLSWTAFDPQGYGINLSQKVVIYHRYGATPSGALERFMIVLNFSGVTQNTDIPFPIDGTWTDLINDNKTVEVTSFKLTNYPIPSNWGCVFFIAS